jgi:hypothetical protein
MDTLSKNKKFIEKKSVKMIKIFLAASLVSIAIRYIPSIYNDGTKVKFFIYVIGFILLSIIPLSVGLYIMTYHLDKNIPFSKVVKLKALGGVLLIFSIVLNISLLNYYKDIPNIINSNYSSFKGKLTNFAYDGKSNSTSLIFGATRFTIDGRGSDFTTIGKDYYVNFLPNSKFVMSLGPNN